MHMCEIISIELKRTALSFKARQTRGTNFDLSSMNISWSEGRKKETR